MPIWLKYPSQNRTSKYSKCWKYWHKTHIRSQIPIYTIQELCASKFNVKLLKMHVLNHSRVFLYLSKFNIRTTSTLSHNIFDQKSHSKYLEVLKPQAKPIKIASTHNLLPLNPKEKKPKSTEEIYITPTQWLKKTHFDSWPKSQANRNNILIRQLNKNLSKREKGVPQEDPRCSNFACSSGPDQDRKWDLCLKRETWSDTWELREFGSITSFRKTPALQSFPDLSLGERGGEKILDSAIGCWILGL